jgi:hypothetical protein
MHSSMAARARQASLKSRAGGRDKRVQEKCDPEKKPLHATIYLYDLRRTHAPLAGLREACIT